MHFEILTIKHLHPGVAVNARSLNCTGTAINWIDEDKKVQDAERMVKAQTW